MAETVIRIADPTLVVRTSVYYVYWHELRADQCILCFLKKGLLGTIVLLCRSSQRTRCCPDSDSLFALYYSFFAAKGCAESAIGFGCSVPLFLPALSFYSIWLLKRLSSNSSRGVSKKGR